MISFLRTIFLFTVAGIVTLVLGTTVIVAALLGVQDKPGGLFEKVPRWWSSAVLWAAGIKVHVQGMGNAATGEPHIFASNHVSWFDVPALAKILPRYKFVAKAELFKVPIFGRGMRIIGMIEIQRENRKAAFGAYDLECFVVAVAGGQERTVRARHRGGCTDRSSDRTRHNRDHAERIILGSAGHD